MDLSNKVAFVTGAGSGIGKAIALEFAKRGAAVALNDIKGDSLSALAREIERLGRGALACPGDVSVRAEIDKAVQAIREKFLRLDIVVNNAGFGHYAPFENLTESDWDRMLNVHLKGCFNVIQAALPTLKASKAPRIINMASVAGLTGTPTHCHYSAAKGGIIGLTKALAKELAQYGITVNAVAPGLVKTPFADLVAPALVDVYLQRTPLKRLGEPEDVTGICAFLASEEASFFTGQVISPNGGFVI